MLTCTSSIYLHEVDLKIPLYSLFCCRMFLVEIINCCMVVMLYTLLIYSVDFVEDMPFEDRGTAVEDVVEEEAFDDCPVCLLADTDTAVAVGSKGSCILNIENKLDDKIDIKLHK